MKIIIRLIGGIALLWLLVVNNLAMLKVFAPHYEQVRRETFEQTKSYRQGMVQELENMRFQYEQSAPEHKAALRSIILHRAADFDESALPPSLRSFLNELRRAS